MTKPSELVNPEDGTAMNQAQRDAIFEIFKTALDELTGAELKELMMEQYRALRETSPTKPFIDAAENPL